MGSYRGSLFTNSGLCVSSMMLLLMDANKAVRAAHPLYGSMVYPMLLLILLSRDMIEHRGLFGSPTVII